jgi:hypothetical protein
LIRGLFWWRVTTRIVESPLPSIAAGPRAVQQRGARELHATGAAPGGEGPLKRPRAWHVWPPEARPSPRRPPALRRGVGRHRGRARSAFERRCGAHCCARPASKRHWRHPAPQKPQGRTCLPYAFTNASVVRSLRPTASLPSSALFPAAAVMPVVSYNIWV